MAERHFGPIRTVVSLRTIIWKEGGFRRNYAEIGYLAQVVLYEFEKLERDDRNGIVPTEVRLQDILELHRKVMKLKEVNEKVYLRKADALKKPHSYYLSIQSRRHSRR